VVFVWLRVAAFRPGAAAARDRAMLVGLPGALHCFQAWRRMDETLLADFMVFHDVIADYPYDLVCGFGWRG
jgi:hypothetical protein